MIDNLSVFLSQHDLFLENLTSEVERLIQDAKDNIETEKAVFRLWAQYGWTMNGFYTIGFYRTPPINQTDADQRSLEFFQKENSLHFYVENDKHPDVCENDIEEALKVFDLSCYKPCAMMLVSIIDGLLLNYQLRLNSKSIQVGRGAVKQVDILSTESDPFYLLVKWNTICFLKYLFDFHGLHRDFQNEPDYVNRNFLMHGMSNRTINKNDCIKLFVAVGNVSRLAHLLMKEKQRQEHP